MQDGHEEDVRAEEDEQRVVHARTEGVREEDEDEEAAKNLRSKVNSCYYFC
jgi:hypothetical protein